MTDSITPEVTAEARGILASVHPDGEMLFKGRIHMSIDTAVKAVAKALAMKAHSPAPVDGGWLVRQLEAWPTRVDPEKTTNIEFLMKEAAKRIAAISTPPAALSDSRALRETLDGVRDARTTLTKGSTGRIGSDEMRLPRSLFDSIKRNLDKAFTALATLREREGG